MDENNQHENIEKIERVCPVCREPVKQYLFVGLFMPLEGRAREIISDLGKAGIMPCIPVDNMIPNEMITINLASICQKCSFISTWAITTEDIENIFNLSIGWVYNPETIKSAIEKLPKNLEILRENLEKILKFSQHMYGENYGK